MAQENSKTHKKVKELSNALLDLYDSLDKSRAASIAKTHLETSVLWIEKALRGDKDLTIQNKPTTVMCSLCQTEEPKPKSGGFCQNCYVTTKRDFAKKMSDFYKLQNQGFKCANCKELVVKKNYESYHLPASDFPDLTSEQRLIYLCDRCYMARKGL
jgi:Zn finger protein HypA/HybF involved in hydrogenase expression